MTSRKTLWIVFGCGGILLAACAAFVGVVVVVVMRNMQIKATPAAAAEHDFEELRGRFQGQSPLIEIDPEDPRSFRVHRSAEQRSAAPVERIDIFAWTPREGKLVRMTLPIWLLRLSPSSRSVSWKWGSIEIEDVNLTIEDIERHGPGLLLDFEDRKGNKVLIWSE